MIRKWYQRGTGDQKGTLKVYTHMCCPLPSSCCPLPSSCRLSPGCLLPLPCRPLLLLCRLSQSSCRLPPCFPLPAAVADCYVFVTPSLDFDGGVTHDPIKVRRQLEQALAAPTIAVTVTRRHCIHCHCSLLSSPLQPLMPPLLSLPPPLPPSPSPSL